MNGDPVKALGGDIKEEIPNLKLTDGPDLVLCGSISLTSVQLDAGLVDEVILIIYPVLLGRVSDSFAARELQFVSTVTTSTGVLLKTYRHLGPLNRNAG